jgi:uncharacterized LabA/DUF88 family protein
VHWKYAILIDGGFVWAKTERAHRRTPTAQDVHSLCARIAESPALQGGRLLRIYWYDAPPADVTLLHPIDGSRLDLSTTSRYREARELLSRLETSSDFALRMGELLVRGWQLRSYALRDVVRTRRMLEPSDLSPLVVQKGVDLRIGLDIARLSLRALVDTLVVVTGDSDLVPAFRFARREGIRVVLEHLGAPIRHELRAHADIVLTPA